MSTPETTPAKPSWSGRLVRFARELVVLGVLLLVSLGLFGWLRGPVVPDVAPAFTLSDLAGKPVTLAELKGRRVVLNFWATWCAPCLAELPMLKAFAAAHPELTVVGVAVDEPGPVRARVARSELAYPVVIGTREVVEAYGVQSFPTTVVVDEEGRVRWTHTGMMLRPHLEAMVWWAGM